MKLQAHQTLIRSLPYRMQSAPTSLDTWKWKKDKNTKKKTLRECPQSILDYFEGQNEVTVSRRDVFNAATSEPFDADRFIAATFLWGYPKGSRHHLPKITKHYATLKEHICSIKTAPENKIENWAKHWESWRQKQCAGIGISTYSKFLYFLETTVHGHRALILDDMIIDVLRRQKFDELRSLASINRDNATKRRYPDYLKVMNETADQLQVEPHQLEMFVFMFGRVLKE